MKQLRDLSLGLVATVATLGGPAQAQTTPAKSLTPFTTENMEACITHYRGAYIDNNGLKYDLAPNKSVACTVKLGVGDFGDYSGITIGRNRLKEDRRDWIWIVSNPNHVSLGSRICGTGQTASSAICYVSDTHMIYTLREHGGKPPTVAVSPTGIGGPERKLTDIPDEAYEALTAAIKVRDALAGRLATKPATPKPH